ncbi:MAG: general secretion pathway protein GspK [Deltaproteobacteria bacterium]|nr:general secretion pathway protein GspK [Deltaproteobacteria bacterium]
MSATTPTWKLGARLSEAVRAGLRATGQGSAGPTDRQRGVALLLAMASIAILTIFSLEFTYTSRVAVKTATYVEAEVEAHLHARAAVELAAMVIGSNDLVEKMIAQYSQMLAGKKPNISIGAYACEFVNAFCKGEMTLMGLQLVNLEGHPAVGLKRGTCGCQSGDDDGRVNINRVNDLNQKQAVFDTLYKLLERNEGVTRPGEIDKDMAQLALNVIDWADKDTLKTDIDPNSKKLVEGSGAEGSNYARSNMKVKDAPFDTTEEVRLVQGMNDKLWCKLKNQLTVYNTEKLNVNTAPIEVIKALICKNLANPQNEAIACARGYQQDAFVPVNVAGQYIEVCRTLKKMLFSPPFANPGRVVNFFDKLGTVVPADYAKVLAINQGRMLEDVGTSGKIVRIQAYGTSGKVQRRITALLDTTSQRYVYWRED